MMTVVVGSFPSHLCLFLSAVYPPTSKKAPSYMTCILQVGRFVRLFLQPLEGGEPSSYISSTR